MITTHNKVERIASILKCVLLFSSTNCNNDKNNKNNNNFNYDNNSDSYIFNSFVLNNETVTLDHINASTKSRMFQLKKAR